MSDFGLNLPDKDNLYKLIEKLKDGLINFSTGNTNDGQFSDEDYRRIRKIILGIPQFEELTPDFLRTYRSLMEYWGYIKEKYSTYAERRTYLAEIFNPMLDILEDTSNIGLNTHYEKLELLGAGGFGQVFKYRNKIINMDFAVKIFSPLFAQGGEGHLERFFREARILFKLYHPNIIKVHDIGMIGKSPYIKMEFFNGKDLNKVLKEYGVLPMDKALVLIEEVGKALKYTHEEVKVVHRDLKPSNIMVAKPNKFRVIDFGLGVFLEKEIVSRITQTGEIVAGGHYTAPELVENPQLLDKRSDIYSLGAIWFTILTGRPPAGNNLKEQLVNLSDINSSYADMIMKCLNPIERRYQTMETLLQQIDEYRKEIL